MEQNDWEISDCGMNHVSTFVPCKHGIFLPYPSCTWAVVRGPERPMHYCALKRAVKFTLKSEHFASGITLQHMWLFAR